MPDLREAWAWIQRLVRRVERLESGAFLENSSITDGRMRFIGGLLLIDSGGTVRVIGTQEVIGTERVDGTLIGVEGSVLDWDGNVILRRTLNVLANSAFAGTLHVAGATTLAAVVTLNDDLILGDGRIIAGSIVIDKNGAYGGRLTADTLLFDTSSALVTGVLSANGGLVASTGGVSAVTGNIVAATGNINAPLGDVGGFSKSFWIDHPTKPGKQLRHGSLEGPEHGVYYRGIVKFDGDGEAVFELPEYFTALVIEDEEPTVQVTPIGRPFSSGAELVSDGRVTVYGDAGREAHVTITAARGHFDVEPDKVDLSSPVPQE